jgi:hypothetical protein
MDGSRRAIAAAFLANLGIALAKLVGFVVTGAASMLAEAIHSLADTANEGLLFLGDVRSHKEADEAHPFGFGRERYFWPFVVALVLFTGGGLFALLEGIEKVLSRHELESLPWAVGILLVAMVLEALSLRTAVHESRSHKGDESWLGFVLHSRRAEVAADIECDPDLPTRELADAIDAIEAEIRAGCPRRRSSTSNPTRSTTGPSGRPPAAASAAPPSGAPEALGPAASGLGSRRQPAPSARAAQSSSGRVDRHAAKMRSRAAAVCSHGSGGHWMPPARCGSRRYSMRGWSTR